MMRGIKVGKLLPQRWLETSAPSSDVRHLYAPWRSQHVYAYNSPAVHKTKPEDLAGHWDKLGFSIRNVNGHVRYTWSNGGWDQGVFVPAPYQLMHINAGALHYGVSVFEGESDWPQKAALRRQPSPMRLCAVQSPLTHCPRCQG